ncbi:dual oxidase [Plakobranchus ocellatus]|uniref:Dual oxidase n=1 Tax=Plakobranchus ocellatus TaxID=259542 RepID=A0AAV4C409_9GAST|nr:dual oxidase [Plakobranchus ocellatus]
MEYVTPPNVTIRGKIYRVVHLSRAFQFIPIGRCRPGSACSYGECVDQYRAHWVLVYNQTDNSHGPPVSFAPVEVPSHCECMNVGRP